MSQAKYESELLQKDFISPDDVRKLTKPTEKFLCPFSANKYFEFLEFRIKDVANNTTVFDVKNPRDPKLIDWEHRVDGPDEMRTIQYTLPASLLTTPFISTHLLFTTCPSPINLRMIERHYFSSRLVKSFEFEFGFCIPSSTNSWEGVYEVPKLTDKELKEVKELGKKGEVGVWSDSFFFVEDKMVAHHKASYTYV
ncbi:GMP-PDE, delta subunit-domain-containing protein [Gaertneriomyces semiglobifer]|nr:GMP-PDE, delta subunit-domain-containing protein [Gaertneriomyces semiglobifer]